jgi:hypothetical protein
VVRKGPFQGHYDPHHLSYPEPEHHFDNQQAVKTAEETYKIVSRRLRIHFRNRNLEPTEQDTSAWLKHQIHSIHNDLSTSFCLMSPLFLTHQAGEYLVERRLITHRLILRLARRWDCPLVPLLLCKTSSLVILVDRRIHPNTQVKAWLRLEFLLRAVISCMRETNSTDSSGLSSANVP